MNTTTYFDLGSQRVCADTAPLYSVVVSAWVYFFLFMGVRRSL